MGSTKRKTIKQTPPKSKKWLYIGVAALIVVLVAISTVAIFGSGSNSPVNQVEIKVQYKGSWGSTYSGISGTQSWNGTGTQTIVYNRPAGAKLWIIYANANKWDNSSNNLVLSILKTDGTVLASSNTTAPYGEAQTSYDVDQKQS
jgi:hypothetical protein